MSEADNNLPDNRFWRFSVDFYRREGVEQALLFLQQRYGFNVNVILYFFWLAMLGQGGLAQGKLLTILERVVNWHNKVVLPLRRVRDTLKKKVQNQAVEALRKEILQEELHAEQIEQMMLYEAQWTVGERKRTPAKKAADICRSMTSYCYLLHVKADDSLGHTLNRLMKALLPELDEQDIAKISSQRLHNHPKMSKVVGTQLWLDL